MEPIPKPEMPVIPKPEAKPAAVPPAPAKEAPTAVPKESPKTVTARDQLEKIAGGTPVVEALAANPESLPNREDAVKLIEEGNKLLLELKDMRLIVSAIASQAADTPLGYETQIDTLRMLRDMSADGAPPELSGQLSALQDRIKALNLPQPKPEGSALLSTITEFNEAHPDKAVPQDVVAAIQSGQKEVAPTVAQMLQTNPDLAQSVWKQLTGIDNFGGLTPTPTNVLQLAGIPTTPENLAKAQEMFGVVAKTPAEKVNFMQTMMPTAMMALLGITAITSIASGGEGGH